MSDLTPHTIQTNFTAGELSPTIEGNTDFNKYRNGCALLENMIIHVQGGASKRSGTKYLAESAGGKTDGIFDKVELIPFVASAAASFMLEWGKDFIRFYYSSGLPVMDAGGVAPFSLAHTLGTTDTFSYTQSADTMYITKWSGAGAGIYKLVKYGAGDRDWAIFAIAFRPPPVKPSVHTFAETITPAAVSGEGVVFTTSGAVFLPGDVGRTIATYGILGRAIISEFTSDTEVKADITETFSDTDPIVAADWGLEGSPNSNLTLPVLPSAGRTGHVAGMSVEKACFRAVDVGKYIDIQDGFLKITSVGAAVNPQFFEGTTYRAFESNSTVPTAFWTMYQPTWTTYPRAVTLFENRLVFGGCPDQPLTVWLSESGNLSGFAPGSGDADAVTYSLTVDQIDQILWMIAHKTILIGTAGCEIRMDGGDEALSPTSVKVKPEIFYGASAIRPVMVGNAAILFVQSGDRRIRELSYSWESDSLVSPDLSRLADHITAGGITKMSMSKEPDPILWCIRADGTLLGMTYERQEQVVGWHRHTTDGLFIDVATLPGGGVWFIVERTIGGVTKRFIETFHGYGVHETGIEDAFFVDCGLSITSVHEEKVFTVSHLIGETVSLLGDGVVITPQVVAADGTVTLSKGCHKLQVGLPYSPIMHSLRPELMTAAGSIQGKTKRVTDVTVRLHKSAGVKVGPDLQHLFTPKTATAPNLFTGDCKVSHNANWEVDGKVVVTQTDPVPLTILSLMLDLVVTK